MINAKSLIPAALSGKHVQVKAPEPVRTSDPQTAKVVNDLFAELQSIFPAHRQAWPDDDALNAAKRTWIKAFMAAKIDTIEQIRFGVEQCRLSGSDFAPSVGKFIDWCRPTPEMLGLPSADKAYRKACEIAHPNANREGVHPAVYHAACETGFYELLHLPEAKSRKLFERAYGLTAKALLAGEPLRELPKALPDAVSVRTPEVAREGIAALRKALGGGQ